MKYLILTLVLCSALQIKANQVELNAIEDILAADARELSAAADE